MVKNMGGTDRIIRLVVGAAILVVGGIAGSWWALLGVVFIVTGFLKFCPAYLPFRINTCRVKTK
jgi:hypothetical protein